MGTGDMPSRQGPEASGLGEGDGEGKIVVPSRKEHKVVASWDDFHTRLAELESTPFPKDEEARRDFYAEFVHVSSWIGIGKLKALYTHPSEEVQSTIAHYKGRLQAIDSRMEF